MRSTTLPNRAADGACYPRISHLIRRYSGISTRGEIMGYAATRQALFDQIRALFEAGGTVREIARDLGLGRRRVERWVRLIAVPEHNTMAPKVCTPTYFGALLAPKG
jgi:hypothetical protein